MGGAPRPGGGPPPGMPNIDQLLQGLVGPPGGRQGGGGPPPGMPNIANIMS